VNLTRASYRKAEHQVPPTRNLYQSLFKSASIPLQCGRAEMAVACVD